MHAVMKEQQAAMRACTLPSHGKWAHRFGRGPCSSFGRGPFLFWQGTVPLSAGDHSSTQQKNINMNTSCGLSTLITKVIFLSALEISCAVSVVVFALDSPEREKREGSTTPCGVKDVVRPGSRTQSRLAAEKTECPLQRTTTRIETFD